MADLGLNHDKKNKKKRKKTCMQISALPRNKVITFIIIVKFRLVLRMVKFSITSSFLILFYFFCSASYLTQPIHA